MQPMLDERGDDWIEDHGRLARWQEVFAITHEMGFVKSSH
jgi:hypothetical protein